MVSIAAATHRRHCMDRGNVVIGWVHSNFCTDIGSITIGWLLVLGAQRHKRPVDFPPLGAIRVCRQKARQTKRLSNVALRHYTGASRQAMLAFELCAFQWISFRLEGGKTWVLSCFRFQRSSEGIFEVGSLLRLETPRPRHTHAPDATSCILHNLVNSKPWRRE